MNSCEYDLDLSGGLMEEIERLTAPPQSDENSKKKKREHCYYKKPGKPHNHDLCDSCGEGGDLLCCDKCPASFHMECCNPPLEDEEVPMGEWVCHRCKSRPPVKAEDDDAASTCSSRSRHSESATSVSRRSSRRPSPVTTTATDMEIIQEVSRETLEPRHPLQILARAAGLMNPKQFEVPKELGCNIQLQGASKKKWWEPAPGKTSSKKLAHELDNGVVPLPAKLCFICSKSCMRSPLLQCDYCPLLFHLDCLNPPLTTPPQGRWMCPNHCEHILDEKLLKSLKLTERVKLWNKFTGPVNQHQSKVQFLNKIHRLHPPFKYKVRHKRKHTIKVPDAIKMQYEFPPPLLPRLHQEPLNLGGSRETTVEDQNLWLGSLVSLHTDICKHLSGSGSQTQPPKTPDSQEPVSKPQVTSAFAPSGNQCSTNTTITKPTASVVPVVKQDINSNSKPCTNMSSSQPSPVLPSNTSTKSLRDEDREGEMVAMDTTDSNSVNSVHSISAGSCSAASAEKLPVLNGINSSCAEELGEDEEVMDTDGATSAHVVNNCSLIQSNKELSTSCTKNSVSESNRVSSTSLLEENSQTTTTITNCSSPNLSSSHVTAGGDGSVTSERPSLIGNGRTQSVESRTCSTTSSVSLGHMARQVRRSRSWNSDISGSGSEAGERSCKPFSQQQENQGVSGLPHSAQNGEVSSTSQSELGQGLSEVAQVEVNSTSSVQGSPDSQHKTATVKELEDLLETESEEMDLSKLDSSLIQLLALQQVKQMFSKTSSKQEYKPTQNTVSMPPQLPVTVDHEVRARALLCPLTGQGEPIPMVYRSLGIGMGADMDACLHKFGTCNFVSPKHACIFYDEATRHFELMNYSEHGTTVDNVLYSCDFSEKQVQSSRPSKLVSSVRKLVKKGKNKKVKEEAEVKVPVGDPNREYMSGTAYKGGESCQCKTSSSSLIGGSGAGWEGTALLHHGSYIKLGCLQFVFSIVEQATQHPIIIHYPQNGEQNTPIKSEPPSP